MIPKQDSNENDSLAYGITGSGNRINNERINDIFFIIKTRSGGHLALSIREMKVFIAIHKCSPLGQYDSTISFYKKKVEANRVRQSSNIISPAIKREHVSRVRTNRNFSTYAQSNRLFFKLTILVISRAQYLS